MTDITAAIPLQPLSLLTRMGGRKFLLSFSIYLGTALLTYLKVIDGVAYTGVTLGVVAAFITGNVAQKNALVAAASK
jgi:hypothetical protein